MTLLHFILSYRQLIASFLILLSIIFLQHQAIMQVSSPDFPFEVLDESITGDTYPASKARVFIAPEYYKKENLEKFFNWYSLRRNRKNELIVVLIFTNRDNLLADKDSEEIEANRVLRLIKPDTPKLEKQVTVRRKAALYDAFFRRRIDYTNGIEEINEIYTYCPDLHAPATTETIVLKGRDPFDTKR